MIDVSKLGMVATAPSQPDVEAAVASAKAHYQRTVENYLAATDERQRKIRGDIMQRALHATLDARYRNG